jgi:hypothetical protein
VKGYPLEALRGLRADEEDAARRALADAIRAQEAAAAATLAASVTRDGHERETQATIERETARALDAVRPSDATQLRAWRVRRREELAKLDASLARARDHEAACGRATEAAREGLASARREREAIDKHHAAWLEERKRAAEAREEAEADDRRSR